MNTSFQGIRQLYRLLFGTGFLILYGLSIAKAAELKDVRIGEYEDFTRVVFEFSETITEHDLNNSIPGRLIVEFPDSRPELIRKIPIYNSTRIRDAQLWQEGTTVSAILVFPFERYRLEVFTLSEPHRIAIDIFPQTAPPTPSAGDNQPHDPSSVSANATQKSATLQRPDATPGPAESSSKPSSAAAKGSPMGHVSPRPEAATETVDKPTLIDPQESADLQSANGEASFTSRLQYYLVIGLVIIIVIVLMLLVLMLLSRNKAKNALAPLSTDEYFQRQDETIASLNARIHEQFKRYDEA